MSDETKPDFTKVTPPPDAQETKDVKEEKPKLKEKPKEDRPRLRRQKLPTLEEQLNEVFAGFAMGVAATGDFYCAEHIANQAPVMAKAWAELAKTNEAVERA